MGGLGGGGGVALEKKKEPNIGPPLIDQDFAPRPLSQNHTETLGKQNT